MSLFVLLAIALSILPVAMDQSQSFDSAFHSVSNLKQTNDSRYYGQTLKVLNVLRDHFGGNEIQHRPSIKPPGRVRIGSSTDLNRIVELNELTQVMTASFWITLQWDDPNLSWDIRKEDFKDVYAVRIPYRYAWTPDITLWNNVDDEVRLLLPEVIITVTNKGHVTWIYPAMVRTVCELNIYDYPFDKHSCEFIFGSWTYNENLVYLEPDGAIPADVTHYVPNNVWKLLDFSVEATSVGYHQGADGKEENFSVMIYTLVYQRRWTLPFVYLVIPNLLINLMVAVSFLLPCESYEKVGVSVTIFLSLVIYLLLFYRVLPFTSSVPMVVRYVMMTVVVTAISLVMNTIILNLHFSGTKDCRSRVPNWARNILLKRLGPWVGLGTPVDEKTDFSKVNKTIDVFEVIPDEAENWQFNNSNVAEDTIDGNRKDMSTNNSNKAKDKIGRKEKPTKSNEATRHTGGDGYNSKKATQTTEGGVNNSNKARSAGCDVNNSKEATGYTNGDVNNSNKAARNRDVKEKKSPKKSNVRKDTNDGRKATSAESKNENKNVNRNDEENLDSASKYNGEARKSIWTPLPFFSQEEGAQRSKVRKSTCFLKRAEVKNNHEVLLYRILKHCEDIKADLVIEELTKEILLEWKQLAFVVDRIMLIIYLAQTFLLWCMLFAQIPTIEDGI